MRSVERWIAPFWKSSLSGAFCREDALLSRQKRANLRVFVYLNVVCCALRDDMAAFCTGFRAHFNEPIGLAQNLRVVIDEQNGVAVVDEIVHHAGEADDVRRCKPMEGSSSTYKTPVVRLRTARASCMRWRSPVESVEAARSSVR